MALQDTTTTTSSTTNVSGQLRHLLHNRRNKVVLYDDDDDDDGGDAQNGLWSRSHQNYNETIITSTVSIRVTPRDDFMVSWGILAAALGIAIGIAAWQVYRERHIVRQIPIGNNGDGINIGVVGVGSRTGGGGGIGNSHNRGIGGSGGNAPRDADRLIESASTAEVTRCVFRRLLLVAMLSRFICIPVMIWSDPIWCQFVGDTLPEMIFATAWTMLVTFFVQVVGIATGTGTNTTPSIVIQLTAYFVYLGLILLELVNSVASVLLYALLCCIYAALLGTIAYFLPRLLSLLMHHGPLDNLVLRLCTCTVVCFALFGCHMIGFARIVVDPPQKVYWWWKYGCLEVIPAAVFLLLLRPSTHHKDRASSNHHHPGGLLHPPPPHRGLIRVDSNGSSHHSNSPHLSKSGNSHKNSGGGGGGGGETTTLSKSPPTMYGATNV